jgi:uncharacterized protein (DUF433 family)
LIKIKERNSMSKYNRIVRDSEICGGQPTIRGTRVLVLDILDWLKEGKSFDEILENFPSISREDIQEIISYAKDMIAGEVIVYGSFEHKIPTG